MHYLLFIFFVLFVSATLLFMYVYLNLEALWYCGHFYMFCLFFDALDLLPCFYPLWNYVFFSSFFFVFFVKDTLSTLTGRRIKFGWTKLIYHSTDISYLKKFLILIKYTFNWNKFYSKKKFFLRGNCWKKIFWKCEK